MDKSMNLDLKCSSCDCHEAFVLLSAGGDGRNFSRKWTGSGSTRLEQIVPVRVVKSSVAFLY